MASSSIGVSSGTPTGTASPELDFAHELISSRRVEGTDVFDRDGKKLGTIHSVMIGKRSGKVGYALLSFGGVLGVGSHVYPIPWDVLDYDVDRDGYTVEMTRDQLNNAPRMSLDEGERPIDQEHAEEVRSYWGALPWWGL